MSLLVLTIALDTEHPEQTQIHGTPIGGSTEALLLAQTLVMLQGQLLTAAARTPEPATAPEPTPMPEPLTESV